MREVLYRKATSQDKRRKFVSLRQRLEQKGRRFDIYRSCTYKVLEERKFKDEGDIQNFISKLQERDEKNHIYLKRIIDTSTGKVVVSQIIRGNIFAILKDCLYRIQFKQEYVIESNPL